jgi:hypothetical protein
MEAVEQGDVEVKPEQRRSFSLLLLEIGGLEARIILV